MSRRIDSLDLGSLALSSGEGRRLALHARHEPLILSERSYDLEPASVPVALDVARMIGGGYSLSLRFEVAVMGPCMRCLDRAGPRVSVDAREVDQPGGGEELDSPYVSDQVLDLGAWSREALVLAVPAQVLCRPDCLGLCPACGANLNHAGPDHGHAPEPDPRWAKLSELRFD